MADEKNTAKIQNGQPEQGSVSPLVIAPVGLRGPGVGDFVPGEASVIPFAREPLSKTLHLVMPLIKAILDGQRDPQILADLCYQRCKNIGEILARSLHGEFRSEYLFSLKQAMDLYVLYQGQISECHQGILSQLATSVVWSDFYRGLPLPF